MRIKLIAGIVLSAVATRAYAGSDFGSDISLQPIIEQLQPYIVAGLGTIITALVAWAVKKIHDKTGIEIQASQVASIKDAMKTQAASMVAAATDNLAGKTFNVGSPAVADAVRKVEERIPDLIKASGATPEALQTILTGEIGKLQVAQTVAPPVPDKTVKD